MSTATCRFCGCTDDSIQVICESRCLICSRCQQISVIRKLLVDHTIAIDVNPSTASQATQTYLKGFCPVCEAPMASTMLSLISTFKELYRANNDEKTMGRLMAGLELEEQSNAISNFLKRYKATYEPHTEARRKPEAAAAQLPTAAAAVISSRPATAGAAATSDFDAATAATATVVNSSSGGVGNGTMSAAALVESRFSASIEDIYDLYTVPTKTSLTAVMEFIADCYAAQWHSMLRHGRDSMVTVMMRLFNRKRFSQRTNDLRTKAMLDFIADSSGQDSADLLLFGRLIGLQPQQTASIRPAWAHISACVVAAGSCERCLRGGHFIDITGHPTLADFRAKVCKAPAAAKSISLRKALRIVQLLREDKQPYWMMTPLIPTCVEFATKLPWDESSYNKLLTVLFFVTLYTDYSNNSNSNSGTESPAFLTQLFGGSTQFPPISGAASATAAGNSSSGSNNNSPFGSPSGRSRRLSAAAEISAAAAAAAVDNIDSNSTAQSRQLLMLRSLHLLVRRIWASSPNATVSATTAAVDVQLSFLGSLHRHAQPSYLKLTAARAVQLAGSRSLLLSELAYVCIHCWDAEYEAVRLAMSRSSTTLMRRPAISGYYDASKATMNGAERLCITRLLHWYSSSSSGDGSNSSNNSSSGDDDGGFRGVDWEDVEQKHQQRMFPFNIPRSLLLKSHNELHHLALRLAGELREQQRRDAREDALAESGPYSKLARGPLHRSATTATAVDEDAEAVMTAQEIARFNRQKFLSNQSIGYAEKIRLEDAALLDEDSQQRSKQQQPPQLHRAASMDPRALLHVENDVRAVAALRDSIPQHAQYGPAMRSAGGLQRPLSPAAAAFSSSAPGGDARRTHAGVHVPIPLQFQQHAEFDTQGNHQQLQQQQKEETLESALEIDSSSASGGIGSTVPPLYRRHSLSAVGFAASASAASALTLNIADIIDNDTAALKNAGLLPATAPAHPQTAAAAAASTADGDFNFSSITATAATTATTAGATAGERAAFRMSDGLCDFEKRVQAIRIHDPRTLLPGMTHTPLTAATAATTAATSATTTGVQYVGNLQLPPLQPVQQSSTYYNEFDAELEYANFEAIYEEVDSKYNSVLSTLRRSKLDAARAKIQKRIEEKAALEATAAAAADGEPEAVAATTAAAGRRGGGEQRSLNDNSVSSQQQRHQQRQQQQQKQHEQQQLLSAQRSANLRTIAHLDFNSYLSRGGQVLVDLSTHLSAESAVRYFSVRDRSISSATFEYIARHFFRPWQLQHLKRIDIQQLPLKQPGAVVLSDHLCCGCSALLHLSLNGFEMGGTGLKRLLLALAQGGATSQLLRLELQGNEITMALDSFALINQFTSLRALDLSHNCFTLDTAAQCRTFTAALSQLPQLRSLSVAHNKIQDRGCQLVCDIASRFLPALQLLDMAHCFLTKACFQTLHLMIRQQQQQQQQQLLLRQQQQQQEEELPPLVLEEILLQGNVFTAQQEVEIAAEYGISFNNNSSSGVRFVTSAKYIGIAFPLRYDIREVGLDQHLLPNNNNINDNNNSNNSSSNNSSNNHSNSNSNNNNSNSNYLSTSKSAANGISAVS